jgi:hypothetical protein
MALSLRPPAFIVVLGPAETETRTNGTLTWQDSSRAERGGRKYSAWPTSMSSRDRVRDAPPRPQQSPPPTPSPARPSASTRSRGKNRVRTTLIRKWLGAWVQPPIWRSNTGVLRSCQRRFAAACAGKKVCPARSALGRETKPAPQASLLDDATGGVAIHSAPAPFYPSGRVF